MNSPKSILFYILFSSNGKTLWSFVLFFWTRKQQFYPSLTLAHTRDHLKNEWQTPNSGKRNIWMLRHRKKSNRTSNNVEHAWRLCHNINFIIIFFPFSSNAVHAQRCALRRLSFPFLQFNFMHAGSRVVDLICFLFIEFMACFYGVHNYFVSLALIFIQIFSHQNWLCFWSKFNLDIVGAPKI